MNIKLLSKLLPDQEGLVNLISFLPEDQQEAALSIVYGVYEMYDDMSYDLDEFKKMWPNATKMELIEYNPLLSYIMVNVSEEATSYYATEEDRDAGRNSRSMRDDTYHIPKVYIRKFRKDFDKRDLSSRYGITLINSQAAVDRIVDKM